MLGDDRGCETNKYEVGFSVMDARVEKRVMRPAASFQNDTIDRFIVVFSTRITTSTADTAVGQAGTVRRFPPPRTTSNLTLNSPPHPPSTLPLTPPPDTDSNKPKKNATQQPLTGGSGPANGAHGVASGHVEEAGGALLRDGSARWRGRRHAWSEVDLHVGLKATLIMQWQTRMG